MADDTTPIPPTDGLPDPGEAELVADLDGELDPAAARKVEAKLAGDPTLRARATALKKTFDLLDFLPRPEPSPTFATRTIDQIPAVKAAVSAVAVPTASAPAVSSSAPILLRTGTGPAVVPSRVRLWAGAVLFAGLIALAGGYFATAVARPYFFPVTRLPDTDTVPLADLRVIERLPVYAVADDIDFVVKLSEAEYFGDNPSVVFDGPSPPPNTDTTDKPTGGELDALVKAFKALPPERQAAVRRLDQQLHELPPSLRDRMYRVLEAYAAWLARLPDTERRGVLAAATPGLRLDAVRQIRDRQWLDSQPAAQKKQLDGLPNDKRAALVGKWRDDAAANRAMWAFARRHWEANRSEKVPWPFDDEARKKEVMEYVRHTFKTDDRVRGRLLPGELDRLREAQDTNAWLWYGKTVYDLSKKYEMLPEPAAGKPLTEFADLWPRAKDHYDKGGPRKRLQGAVGKWPEFALAVQADLSLTKFGPPSSSSYGPCRPADFKEPLKAFVAELEKKARPAEWAALKDQEGRWPEYPRALVKLAAQHDLSVPGVTLPGAPSLWEKTYNPPMTPTPKRNE
ncbi:MAG TPA: hypothetical protein VMZ71_04685 [Gemmataceae bacterium]|nr:hypothetical protein [Gemmataceae bacterium]